VRQSKALARSIGHLRIHSGKSSIAGVFAAIVVAVALIGSLILIAKYKLQEKATTELVLHNFPSRQREERRHDPSNDN
jgi:Na+/melibiose symporter-like transporter